MRARGEQDRLRVLMIAPQFRPLVGGYERACERLSGALSDAGHEVLVCSERVVRSWPVSEDLRQFSIRRWWCVYRPGLHMATSLFGLLGCLVRFGRRHDVWHVHQFGLHAALCIAMGKLMSRPVLVKVTNTGDDGLLERISKGRFARLVRFLHQNVDAMVALTEETAAEAEALGVPQSRIHILGNGVEIDAFRPRTELERAMLKGRLGLETQHAVVFVGRLTPSKNVEGLLRAWSDASTELGGDWQLLILGDGPLRSRFEALAAEIGVGSSIRFLGQESSIEEWLSASDIYVSTSWIEGLSNTLLEAMASGLPIVATKVSGVRELVGASGAGFCVPLGDMQAVGAALVSLARDPDDRVRRGRLGRAVVEARYAVGVVGLRHEQLYRQLIASTP